MLYPSMDPNERFRARRGSARRRKRRRRAAVAAILLFAVLALAGGMTLAGKTEKKGSTRYTVDVADDAVVVASRPRPLPVEVRGVHVTGALASLPGKLAEYAALKRYGLNTIELDVKDEGGEISFAPSGVPLARKTGAVRSYYSPRQVADMLHRKGLYLIGRIVVFQDPYLARARPDLAVHRPDGSIWTTCCRARLGEPLRPAGLGLQHLDRRGGGEGRLRRDHARLHALPVRRRRRRHRVPGPDEGVEGRGDRRLRGVRATPPRAARRPCLDRAVRALRDAGHRRRPGAALDLASCRRHPSDGVSLALRRRGARHRLAQRRARGDGLSGR